MIYKNKPNDFKSSFDVVSSFIEYNGKILLLKRNISKTQGNKWGVPAGKISINEEPLNAIVREVFEETGNSLSPTDFKFYKTIYVKHDQKFTFYMYHLELDKKLYINLNDKEHHGYDWVTPFNALKMNLVTDLDECINMFYFSK